MADGWSSVSIGFTDEGPGIADVDLALADGWSMGDGLGLGLPGARRLVASAGHALGYQRPAGRRPASWVRRPHVQRTNIPVMAAIRPAVELSWASRRVLACRAVPARQI